MTNPAAALLRVSLVVSAGLLVPAVLLAETAPPADYIRAVHERVAKVTVYPKMAKLRGQEGKVGCVVKISPTGDLLDESVEKSSGTAALDEAALDAVKKAAPFPPPPGADANGAALHFTLSFALTD